MKRLMVAALALSLLDASAVLAQEEHHGGGGGGGAPHGEPGGGHPGGGAPGGGHPEGGHPDGGGRPDHGGFPGGGRPEAGPRGGDFHPQSAPQRPAPEHNDFRTPAPRTTPYAYVPGSHGDRPHPEGGQAGPGGRGQTHLGHAGFGAPGFQANGGDRPRYDARYFPQQIRPSQRFHWRGQGWQQQPGYSYRRWRYGEYLPQGWFAASFWIDDYTDYDLPVPPYGYEWVRVGPDGLLVDTYTGEVVETIYGLFY